MFQSLGAIALQILLPTSITNLREHRVIQLRIDVVDTDLPLLLPQQSLVRMDGVLNFERSTLTIREHIIAHLGRTPSVHIITPGV